MQQVGGERFLASDLPAGRVAVLFCADWCGYCHRFLPMFKRLPFARSERAWLVDISDEDAAPWDTFAIRVVPTVIVFEDGVEKARWSGVLGDRHADAIQAALAAQDSSDAGTLPRP